MPPFCERMSAGRNCTFRLTLFATTLVVAVTAYGAAFVRVRKRQKRSAKRPGSPALRMLLKAR